MKLLLTALLLSALSPGRLTLHYDRPAAYFEEALPIGNGRLGEEDARRAMRHPLYTRTRRSAQA